jgi:hypothetical protein
MLARHTRTALTGAVLAVALAACGGGSKGSDTASDSGTTASSSPSASPTPSIPAKPLAPETFNVCEKMAAADAAKIIGYPVKPVIRKVAGKEYEERFRGKRLAMNHNCTFESTTFFQGQKPGEYSDVYLSISRNPTPDVDVKTAYDEDLKADDGRTCQLATPPSVGDASNAMICTRAASKASPAQTEVSVLTLIRSHRVFCNVRRETRKATAGPQDVFAYCVAEIEKIAAH